MREGDESGLPLGQAMLEWSAESEAVGHEGGNRSFGNEHPPVANADNRPEERWMRIPGIPPDDDVIEQSDVPARSVMDR